MSDRRIDVSWKCEREGSGSSGIPLKHSGLSELQLMELIAHLRGTLEGAMYVDTEDSVTVNRVQGTSKYQAPYWKLERINWEHDKTDKAWGVLMKFHEKELEWDAIDGGHIDCDVEAGTVGVEGEE